MTLPTIFENDLCALVKGRRGVFLAPKFDRFIGRALIEYGEFSEIQWQLLAKLVPPGGVAIDVGANIGGHTVSFAGHVGPGGRVYAFEPQPFIFQILCANMALNGFSHVRAFQAGCGERVETMRMPPVDYGAEGNFGGLSLSALKESRGDLVSILTLDGMFDEERLDLVKIDVEGMEREVLEGARGIIARYRPALYVENDRSGESAALISLIFELGYRAWWHTPPLFNPKNFAGRAENVLGNFRTVNLLCLPRERSLQVRDMKEVLSPGDRPD